LLKTSYIKSLSDNELLEKYRISQDNQCLGELFDRYAHFMYCVCLKYLQDTEKSKDAVMQIVEKLMNDLLKHEPQNFKSWLHVVAKNHCLMQLRSAKGNATKIEYHEKELASVMETDYILHHDNSDDIDIKLDLLKEAITELDSEQKKCIELFYLQDKSYADITLITGYDLNKVKSYIQNGKRNLKILIEKNYGRKVE